MTQLAGGIQNVSLCYISRQQNRRESLTASVGLSKVLVALSLRARWATETRFFFRDIQFLKSRELLYLIQFHRVARHVKLRHGAIISHG
jgi:hypothetical protein